MHATSCHSGLDTITSVLYVPTVVSEAAWYALLATQTRQYPLGHGGRVTGPRAFSGPTCGDSCPLTPAASAIRACLRALSVGQRSDPIGFSLKRFAQGFVE